MGEGSWNNAMWSKTRVTERLGIEVPIIQAGMAGGSTTAALVAAVSNAGGLGTLGAGYMTPEGMRTAIRNIRALTDRPFAVNLLVPHAEVEGEHKIEQAHSLMQTYRDELGIGTPHLHHYAESFDEQLDVVLEEGVPVLSFTFGLPNDAQIKALKKNNTVMIGTATTMREGVLLEQHGIDIVVGQGHEAGGHRGTFLGSYTAGMTGTMALIPQLADELRVPVIAAGGIMDGRGLIGALALGAEAVQMGTAFLTCSESGAHEQHKSALLLSTDESTVITRAFSGKPARGLMNRFISEMERHADDLPGYPIQNALTRDIRQAASQQGRAELLNFWSGQASRLCTTGSAAELIAAVMEQADRLVSRWTSHD